MNFIGIEKRKKSQANKTCSKRLLEGLILFVLNIGPSGMHLTHIVLYLLAPRFSLVACR
jgi:hypothetical protein